MEIALIKNLRDITGSGIADCRRALEEANGDIKVAQEVLQKEEANKASQKADREIKSGLIFSYLHNGGAIGVLLHLGCETDFVAKTDDFLVLGKEIAMQIVAMNPADIAILLDQDYIRDASKKIKDLLDSIVAKTGENCSIVEFSRFSI